jgi:hypothetical protein
MPETEAAVTPSRSARAFVRVDRLGAVLDRRRDLGVLVLVRHDEICGNPKFRFWQRKLVSEGAIFEG